MLALRFAIVVFAVGLLPATSSQAAEERVCLTKSEQRTALSNGQTVTLASAIKSARGSIRGRGSREVVQAKLCREDKGLLYLLTMLAVDGKVIHASVDATSGKLVEVR